MEILPRDKLENYIDATSDDNSLIFQVEEFRIVLSKYIDQKFLYSDMPDILETTTDDVLILEKLKAFNYKRITTGNGIVYSSRTKNDSYPFCSFMYCKGIS